jgi:hypothetical protein
MERRMFNYGLDILLYFVIVNEKTNIFLPTYVDNIVIDRREKDAGSTIN